MHFSITPKVLPFHKQQAQHVRAPPHNTHTHIHTYTRPHLRQGICHVVRVQCVVVGVHEERKERKEAHEDHDDDVEQLPAGVV